MKLEIKLLNKKLCTGCPCLQRGACAFICKYFHKAIVPICGLEHPPIKRLKECKKLDKKS